MYRLCMLRFSLLKTHLEGIVTIQRCVFLCSTDFPPLGITASSYPRSAQQIVCQPQLAFSWYQCCGATTGEVHTPSYRCCGTNTCDHCPGLQNNARNSVYANMPTLLKSSHKVSSSDTVLRNLPCAPRKAVFFIIQIDTDDPHHIDFPLDLAHRSRCLSETTQSIPP